VNQVRVFAPASVSNLACGFDTLGFAIDGLGDEVTVRLTSERASQPAVRITGIKGDQGQLPLQAERNTAAVAALAVLAQFHERTDQRLHLELELDKQMPLSSGLGSSAASAVAGAMAAYELVRREYDCTLEQADLIECALAGELVASGGRHADNVAPSLIGGIVLVRALDPIPDVVGLPDCSDWLWCGLAKPEIAIDTMGSRQRLGATVPLTTAIAQWSNLGALVAALYQRDEELLSRSLVDHVAEPARRQDVPGFTRAMNAAREAGALGGSLSGSGPTLFALATSPQRAEEAAKAMAGALSQSGHTDCLSLVSAVGTAGARVVEPAAPDGDAFTASPLS